MNPHRTGIYLMIGVALTCYSDATDTDLEDRLKNIIIPRVEFRDANVADVLHFLFDATIAAAPDHKRDIQLGRIVTNDMRRPQHNVSEDTNRADTAAPPTITLNLERISLYDLISEVTHMVDMAFKLEDGQLILLTKDGQTITRPKASNHH